jgi:Phospholipase_D-nuclease N-terminal
MLTVIVIIWLLIWSLTLFDLFHRDWSVPSKALWSLGMLIFPVIGVIAYFIVRPPAASDVDAGVGSHNAPEERIRDRHPV